MRSIFRNTTAYFSPPDPPAPAPDDEAEAAKAGDDAAKEGADKADAEAGEKEDGRKVPWYSKRITAEAYKAREAERQRAEAEDRASKAEARAADAEKRARGEKDDEAAPAKGKVDPRIALADPEIAAEVERQATAKAAERTVTAAIDRMYKDGVKEFGKGEHEAALSVFKDMGGLRMDLARCADRLPNGAAILHHLGTNPETLRRLYELDSVDLAVEVSQMSKELSGKTQKPVSNAKPPINPINPGGSVELDLASSDSNMADWIRAREDDLKKRSVRGI